MKEKTARRKFFERRIMSRLPFKGEGKNGVVIEEAELDASEEFVTFHFSNGGQEKLPLNLCMLLLDEKESQ